MGAVLAIHHNHSLTLYFMLDFSQIVSTERARSAMPAGQGGQGDFSNGVLAARLCPARLVRSFRCPLDAIRAKWLAGGKEGGDGARQYADAQALPSRGTIFTMQYCP